jgi:hypothetical protein
MNEIEIMWRGNGCGFLFICLQGFRKIMRDVGIGGLPAEI